MKLEKKSIKKIKSIRLTRQTQDSGHEMRQHNKKQVQY